jgi:hypothetical protein
MGNNFNQSIRFLPPNLLFLELGNKFNKSIDHLPNSLEKIEFGSKLNKPFNNIPTSLKYVSYYDDSLICKYMTDLPTHIIKNIQSYGHLQSL